jgi:hypothetical protein
LSFYNQNIGNFFEIQQILLFFLKTKIGKIKSLSINISYLQNPNIQSKGFSHNFASKTEFFSRGPWPYMLGLMFEVISLVSMAISPSSKPTIYIHGYEKNIQRILGLHILKSQFIMLD